jgi:hypothetical protein
MGHYDNCYEASNRIREKKRREEFLTWVKKQSASSISTLLDDLRELRGAVEKGGIGTVVKATERIQKRLNRWM